MGHKFTRNVKGLNFFNRLLQSVQQMDAIVRGESPPSRTFVVDQNDSIGSDFDEFLTEHCLTQEVTFAAIAQLKEHGDVDVIIRKLVTASEMKKRGVQFLPTQVVKRSVRRFKNSDAVVNS